jgi:omega-amidase
MKDLNVTIVQTNLIWHEPEANRAHIQTLLSSSSQSTDLIVLPEMFTTGFSMQPELVAEKFDATEMVTLRWMRKMALQFDAVICGSVSVSDDGSFYNRLLWVRPDGSFNHYDKRHTFSFAGEDKHYDKGGKRIVEQWRGWNICPLICYDLRFPVWSRNGLNEGNALYDVLLYVANWPEARKEPWKKLLLARAIENQSYLLACNRVGSDANANHYCGDSSVINPRGEYIITAPEGEEALLHASLSYQELKDFRDKFPVLHDADGFGLRMD